MEAGDQERREFRTSRKELICLGFKMRVMLQEFIYKLACEGKGGQGKIET